MSRIIRIRTKDGHRARYLIELQALCGRDSFGGRVGDAEYSVRVDDDATLLRLLALPWVECVTQESAVQQRERDESNESESG